MKYIITAALLLSLLMGSQAGVIAQGRAFSIRGKIAKPAAFAKAYIFYESGDAYMRDSTLLKNGSFTFKGTIEQGCRSTFIIDEQGTGPSYAAQDHRFNFYMEPGVITIESPDSVAHLTISGTPLNTDLNELRVALKPVGAQMEALSPSDTAARKALRLQRDEVMKQFIKNHPASLVSFDALKEYAGVVPDPARVEPVYNYLSDSLKTRKAIAAYYQLLQDIKKTAIGQIAPDFTQADTAGHDVSLHDFKGRYVLVDFWASWCKPCRHENPVVVKAFNQYKDKNFTILSVSLDMPGAKDKWLKAIHDDGLQGWTHVSDLNFWSNAIVKLYAVQSVPQNFLLDPQGKIIAKNLRGNELEATLHDILDSH